MAKPQQPELHRSGRGATDPASAKAVADAPAPLIGGERRSIPPDNEPGHHPPQEQDKPEVPPVAMTIGEGHASHRGALGSTARMQRARAQIVVEPRPDGRWARQKNGTARAASLHDTQAAAERAARAQAKRERTELVVKGRNGRIERRDSFGTDPRSRKG